jgi:hypothetical protein
MAKKREADRTVDALYTAPPKEFTATRARVVQELKAAGRTDEARALAKMKRPPASVWAVNQLARAAPDAVAELLELGAGLRSAEKQLLKGGQASGNAGEYLADARTARQKVAALARRAETLLAEAGHKATAPLARKISHTLQAAAVADDDTRAALEAGTLTQDLTPASSFGGGDLSSALSASVATAKQTHPKKPERAAERAPEPKLQRAQETKRAKADEKRAQAIELRERRREQAAARKQAAALRRAADLADREVAARKRDVDKAREAVEDAEAELRAAKDALIDAENAAHAARRAADAAEQR